MSQSRTRGLEDTFAHLQPPPTGGSGLRFAVADVPGISYAKLGKSIEGGPALLLTVRRSGSPPQDIRLRNLIVLFSALCRVTGTEGTTEDRYAVVSCEAEPGLTGYFLQAVDAFVAALGDMPTVDDIDRVLHGFVELFRAASQGPRRATQGLWGELLLMALSSDPRRMLASWHGQPDERYDFAEGDLRLEVKTCGRQHREHHFALEQLTGDGVEVLIGSLMVESSSAGSSISDLVDEVGAELSSPAAVARLMSAVGEALGTQWRDFAGARFDRALAASSLRIYRAGTIPRVHVPPVGVTQVSFVSDLSTCRPLSREELHAIGGIASCLS